MGFSVKQRHDEVTIDGDAQGYVGVATPAAYTVGQIVFLSNRGVASLRCTVTEVTATKIRLLSAPLPTGASRGYQYGGGTDLTTPTAYTTVNNACVDTEDQVVPGRTSP